MSLDRGQIIDAVESVVIETCLALLSPAHCRGDFPLRSIAEYFLDNPDASHAAVLNWARLTLPPEDELNTDYSSLPLSVRLTHEVAHYAASIVRRFAAELTAPQPVLTPEEKQRSIDALAAYDKANADLAAEKETANANV